MSYDSDGVMVVWHMVHVLVDGKVRHHFRIDLKLGLYFRHCYSRKQMQIELADLRDLEELLNASEEVLENLSKVTLFWGTR